MAGDRRGNKAPRSSGGRSLTIAPEEICDKCSDGARLVLWLHCAPEEHDVYSLSLVFICAPAERNDMSLLRSEKDIGMVGL
jgi:hypothetical protein